MKEVLMNLANVLLLQYCKDHGIDPSNSHVEKAQRGFRYQLVDNSDGAPFIDVLLTKNTTPKYFSYQPESRVVV